MAVPDPPPMPLRGLRRGAAIVWVIGVVALYVAVQLGFHVVR